MRCKSCDYPLWNIKARQCPECGISFAPSQYDFVINSVQFCCPNCEQAYYGTGVKGHLVPREFHCVTCGQLLHMDLMLLRPAKGVTEDQTQIDRMPWLERKQRGFVKAWFQTLWKSLFDPVSLMRGVPVEEGPGNAWAYATLTLIVFLMCGGGIPLLCVALMTALFQGRADEDVLWAAGGVVLGGTVGMLLLILLWGACAHGILRFKAVPAHPIRRTYQALLYSVGTNAPLATPCVSVYCTPFTWIWWAISATFMLAHAQRVSAIRAGVAIFALPCLLFLAGTLWIVGTIASEIMSAPRTFTTTMQQGEVAAVASSLLSHAVSNNGKGPTHALELMNSAGLSSAHFVASGGLTDATVISIANTTLSQFDFLPPNRQAAAIQAAASSLPANVIAHRCGDFVFTYHRIDFNQCDPALWSVILSPDPDFPSFGVRRTGVYVGLVDGTHKRLPGTLPSELAKQNQLRAKFNLPPLPDPSTVTHGTPAAGN